MNLATGQAADAEAGFAIALSVARACGVTRLADITGLDRIGMPVWQAVRPWGLSLSVHQGKGLDAAQARLGACMEAIECSHAEAWEAPVRRCALIDLPEGERAAVADDFGRVRGAIGDGSMIDWVAAERVDRPGRLWVPLASVSLDFAADAPAGLARSSNGQGAGFDLAWAEAKALGELIERDAFADWAAGNVVSRMDDEIDLGSIGFDWFAALHARCAALGIVVRAYRVPAVIAMPVIAVELYDAGGEAATYAHAGGSCAHADPEAALRGAVTEAIQARLTVIAGARDDLGHAYPQGRRARFGYALARTGAAPLAFGDLCGFDGSVVMALAAAGYDRTARITLSPPESLVVTVRMIVPGLGLAGRARRVV